MSFDKLAVAFAASTIGEERPWRISGEVVAFPNDARETVGSAFPESTCGCAELAYFGRDSVLRQGQLQG